MPNQIQEENAGLIRERKNGKDLLFAKNTENIELQQELGEYKLKLQQFGVTIEQQKGIETAAKKKIVDNAIESADVMQKLMQLENRATQEGLGRTYFYVCYTICKAKRFSTFNFIPN